MTHTAARTPEPPGDQLAQAGTSSGSFREGRFQVRHGKEGAGEIVKGILELFWLLRRKLIS